MTEGQTLSKFPLAQADGVFRGVFCDGNPGLFDGHAKLHDQGALEAIFPIGMAGGIRGVIRGGKPSLAPGTIARYAVERLKAAPDPAVLDWLGRQLKPLPRAVSLPASAGVPHRFTVTRGQVVAFERNITYQMSEELKQAGGNEALEKPVELDATLSQPAHVYNLRHNGIWDTSAACASYSIRGSRPLFALTRDRLATEAIVAALSDE